MRFRLRGSFPGIVLGAVLISGAAAIRPDGEWRAVTRMPPPLPSDDPPKSSRTLPPGNWGGNHVGLRVTERGARLEFDCAHGAIDEPIAVDEKGTFDSHGTYAPEAPGPIREGEPRSRPARYIGKVEQDTMTLTVILTGDQPIGTFTLVRDRFPRVRKCG